MEKQILVMKHLKCSYFSNSEANNPFKEKEQQAIVNFVKRGGSVIFISDHYNADRNLNRIDSSESMNGYRRGAYQDMTKDMNSGEKTLKQCKV